MNDTALSPSANDLLTQLATGPSLREVAAATLRSALAELYPDLDIDPNLAILVTPRWQSVSGEVVPDLPHLQSLAGALARSALTNVALTWIDGERYLINQTQEQANTHVSVQVDRIAQLINELAPLLFVSYQEQQLDFWNQSGGQNGPRWKTLARTLRNLWNVHTVDDWDDDECAMARNVFHYPEYAQRQPHDNYDAHVYLIDMDEQAGSVSKHLNVTSMALVVGQLGTRELILGYSIATGYKKFSSMKAFGEYLAPHPHLFAGREIHWRLFEPSGNFFEYQASSLISLQIEALRHIAFDDEDIKPLSPADSAKKELHAFTQQDQSRLGWARDSLPGWLQQASSPDQSAYGRYMMDLAALNLQENGKTYMDDIPAVGDFARDALRAQMIKDHPEAANVNLENVQIAVTSAVIWGTLAVPGQTQTQTFTLTELALENLIALPLGNKVVIYRNGTVTPIWMTAQYLEKLITQVDIGKHYPALIKSKLLEDPAQSLRRQKLYTEQLRLQLPLLALQYKIRGLHGLTEQGYRYVCAVMNTETEKQRVDGYPVVIRPLALYPKRRLTTAVDTVDNMFIIGPQAPKNGPCLLYRPLSNEPLMEFASEANLLYEIKQSATLRQSILAWLPDKERTAYGQFVFTGTLPSPWVFTSLLNDPLNALVMTGPIRFGNEVLRNDYFATLFKTHAMALANLADRQSVSNAEGRWESLKHMGWQIFTAALPFMGKTVGAASWIWQLMDDLQHVVDAREINERPAELSAWVDILLTLGMVLTMHISTQRRPSAAIEKETRASSEPGESSAPSKHPKHPKPSEPAEPSKPPPAMVLIQKPTITAGELPADHQGTLHASGALTQSRRNLGAILDALMVEKPSSLSEQYKEDTAYKHLYSAGEHWYAPVGTRWFEVDVDENDSVLIVDPKQSQRTGFPLTSNRAGQWFIDIRFRLKASGLRRLRQKGQRLKPPKIKDLREQLNSFDKQLMQRHSELEALREAIAATPEDAQEAARTSYLAQADNHIKELDVTISQLKSLKIIDTVPNYLDGMYEYLTNQIFVARSAINEQLDGFQQQLRSVEGHMDPDDDTLATLPLSTYQKVYEVTQDMIERLTFIETPLREMRELGERGVRFATTHGLGLANVSLTDLKAFKISLSTFLCLNETKTESLPAAREAVARIIETAELAVQSLRVALDPENEATQDQLIETLDSLVDQFASVDQNLVELPADFPDDLQKTPLANLRKQIDEFAQNATRELTGLLRERKAQTLEPMPGPSRPSSRVTKRVIKTHLKGIVIGEERLPDAEGSTALVEVKEPLTGKVIATFHEKEPGVWVEQLPAARSTSRTQARNLKQSTTHGQALLDTLEAFITRTEVLSNEAGWLPVTIEERISNRIEQLMHASQEIEEALTLSNLTESTTHPSAMLNKRLSAAISKLQGERKRLHIHMLKTRQPTAAHVELLLKEGVVTIKPPTGARIKLTGRHSGFLQEYPVVDIQTKKTLWYAHFHYTALTGSEENFTAAHLKTPDQRGLGGKYERRNDASRNNISIYRSEISPQLARMLFFKSKPPQPAVEEPQA